MTNKSGIQVDVYVTPLLKTSTGSADPRKQWFSPISCTLIHTAREAILIDVSPTVGQTEEIADWIDKTTASRCQLKYFWTTHAHGDHFLGLPALQKRYPGITALATAKVLEGVEQTYNGPLLQFWQKTFSNYEVSGEHPKFEPLPSSNEMELDGHVLKAYDVQQGDTIANSFLHVPDLSLVVPGDLVYGDCHQYFAEANTREMRRNWTKAVEQIESLHPQIVVPGHKRPSQIDGAYLLASTKEYTRIFDAELEKADSAEALEAKMKELYPLRWNDYILEVSCQASFANKDV